MPSPSLVVQAVGAARFCRAWAELRWGQPGGEMLLALWAAVCIYTRIVVLLQDVLEGNIFYESHFFSALIENTRLRFSSV